MSARDDLAKAGVDWMIDGRTEYQFADDLLASGWRPPARVITTLAELDACEKGTIVRTVDGSAWNLPTGSAVLIGGKSLPATVLWESGDPR